MAPPWHVVLLVAVASAIKCPDGRSCGDEMACCALADGNGYGCCMKEVAVSRSLPMITTEVPCTVWAGCPEEYSCVATPRGGSACCPLNEGTSCQDGHHCCPTGSTCSEEGHFCVPDSVPDNVPVNQTAIICPDGTSECPSDATCCQLTDQRWGCCPLQQAVCCSDHVHCCPQNTVCDLTHGTCSSKNGNVPMVKKLPARMKLQGSEASEKSGRTPCHDGSSCPDGSTCCELGEHSFGCCPLISAVCCGDRQHCCPAGTKCDLVHLKCISKDSETPMYTKTPSLREEASVYCNDTARCPDSTTCCMLSSGQWGCCPYENAVCCPDKVHCCPNGFRCGETGCVKDEASIPWLKKTPALKEKSTNVPCDETTSCPDDNTCCRLPSGEWGCCPIVQAVCCADHEHCCPTGYTCDVRAGTCTKPGEAKHVAAAAPAERTDVVWCDSGHYCYDGQTCCIGPTGFWTCCPYALGLCCPDRVHCCPYGYVCLGGGVQCSRSGGPVWDRWWTKMKPAL